MPLFYYILKNGTEPVPDRDEYEFPSQAAACSHAIVVARELMRNREQVTRSWRLQVCDDDLRPVLELPFVEIDDSICHLPPESRTAIQNVCRNISALSDSICDVLATMHQIRTTIARADECLTNSPLGCNRP